MIDGVWQTCYKCKCTMWLPQALETSAQAARGQISFYCAYGHGQVYTEGETEETKLRRERDRLAQRIAEKDDELAAARRTIEAERRSASAMKGQVTKIKNRVGRGVCPCCNRTFENLGRHMGSKHPDFATLPSNNVVPIKAA